MPITLQPARIAVDDALYLRQFADHPEHLVHLLLVLGHHKCRVAMIDHIGHFSEIRVLIQAHRRPSVCLSGQLREHPLRAVVADDRDLVASLHSQRNQPEGKLAHPVAVLRPGEGLPNPKFLFPKCDFVAQLFRVSDQQLGKSILTLREFHGAHGRAKSTRDGSCPR